MAERTTAEIAELTTLFDLESDLGLAASVVLAEKGARPARFAIAGLMLHAEHSVVDKSDLRLVEDCLYAAGGHAFSARKRLDEATPTVAVHPPLNEPVTHAGRGADCPICGAAITHTGPNQRHGHSGSWEDHASCSRCDVRMHEECYWGRVASLAEFQEYRRQIVGGDENYAPDVVCAQCRAKGERV